MPAKAARRAQETPAACALPVERVERKVAEEMRYVTVAGGSASEAMLDMGGAKR